MNDKSFPTREPYLHEISTNEELRFLARWLSVLFEQYPEARGKINNISITMTGKFVGIDQSGTLSIEKVEGFNDL